MTARTEQVDGPGGPIPVHVDQPDSAGPHPGIVVIHDALGMSNDLRRQAAWLVASGFLAMAPDLYHGGRTLRWVSHLSIPLTIAGWLSGAARGRPI